MARTARGREDATLRPRSVPRSRATTHRSGQVIRREYSRRGIMHRLRLIAIILVLMIVLIAVTGRIAHVLSLLLIFAVAVLALGLALLVRRVMRWWHELGARRGRQATR